MNAAIAAVRDAAHTAYAAGLSILPPVEDGSKRPQPNAHGEWNPYKKTRATAEDIQGWWPGRSGLGVVVGVDHVECWDFDDRQTYDAVLEAAEAGGLFSLIERIEDGYCDDTPGGGVRWLVRYAAGVDRERDGKGKLARRPKRPDEQRDQHDKVKTLIELPDYAIVAPTNGRVHPTGGSYRRRSGDFPTIATYSAEERAALIALARSFDEMPRPDGGQERPREGRPASGDRPGDDFNRRASWTEVLEPHGWRRTSQKGGVTHWGRPGKTFGESATTNFADSDLFYVFSSSTEFEQARGYNKFSVFAILNHDGDFKAAARALAKDGYGKTIEDPEPPFSPNARAAAAEPASEPRPWARRLPDLIADAARAPDVPPLIADFVLAGLITLLHGQPRDWKTIVALHVALAVATGRALFDLARLSVPAARSVLYLTEEDGVRRVTDRLRMICTGLGVTPPANLFVAAGSGFSFDDPESQGRLIAFVQTHDIALVILDPLRSLSSCVDQGPKELRPLTLTLRALMRATGGCTIFAVHHDSKPLAVGVDGRRRPQRASGGAVFSIADSPIGIDAMPDGRRLLTPTAWKFSEDPPSILVALAAGDGWLRLAGGDADGATSAGDADLIGRILAYLVTNPRTSGGSIQKGVKARKADVFAALERLASLGRIDCVKVGRSMRWFACEEKTREPLGNHRNPPHSEADPMGPDAGPTPQGDAETLNDSMVPDVGNRSEPYRGAGPDTRGVPVNGSRSYIGTVPGNHAATDPKRRGADGDEHE